MPIARGRVTLVVATVLTMVLGSVACSRSGGPGVSPTQANAPQTQGAPATQETKTGATADQDEKTAEVDCRRLHPKQTNAPELQGVAGTGG